MLITVDRKPLTFSHFVRGAMFFLLWFGLGAGIVLGSVASHKKVTPKVQAQKIKKSSLVLPELLKEVEQKYNQAQTLMAKFGQVNNIKSTQTIKRTSGVIWLRRPDRIRWETRDPDPNILVSDGAKFWFYTPPFDEEERGQVVIRKTSEVRSKLATVLMAGAFSEMEDMKLIRSDSGFFELVPSKGSAGDVSKAKFRVDPKKKVIDQVILEHEGGNVSEITLTDIELGQKIEDKVFDFKIPPKTEVIED